jgi:hypothetical protein
MDLGVNMLRGCDLRKRPWTENFSPTSNQPFCAVMAKFKDRLN